MVEYNDERNRAVANLRQHYHAWMDATRELAALPYGMKWRESGGAEYLRILRDRAGNGDTVGRRDADTEAVMEKYQADKAALSIRVAGSRIALEDTCRIYRTLGLPTIASQAAAVLRVADRRRLLGSHLLAIGTSAMAAYELEAASSFNGADMVTDDFDMAWVSDQEAEPTVVWPMLQEVDSTYTVNTEKPFQARNSKAYEIEFLAAPSRLPSVGRRDQPRPVALPEQEWLLEGMQVDHVVVGRDGSPARLVVPDPRWFALQKAWMSGQDKRSPQKRPKDARQAARLLDTVATHMPGFPLDEAFEASLPPELEAAFRQWKDTTTATPRKQAW